MFRRFFGISVSCIALSACTADAQTPPASTPSKPTGDRGAEALDQVTRLVEEGKVAEAQALAKGSHATGRISANLEGILYYAVGQADKALAPLMAVHSAEPTNVRVTLLLAEVTCWKKDAAEAQRLADSVPDSELSGKPRYWELALHKAKADQCLKRLEAAEAMFAKLRAASDVPERTKLTCDVEIARIASWKKDFPKALQLTGQILQAYPGNVEATLVKGKVLEWKADYKGARATYREALQVHPEDPQLRYALEQLSWVK